MKTRQTRQTRQTKPLGQTRSTTRGTTAVAITLFVGACDSGGPPTEMSDVGESSSSSTNCDALDEAQENRKRVQAFYARVLGEHDLASAGEYIRADYVQHNPTVGQGLSGFVEYFGTFFAAAPDTRFDVLEIRADGDRVFVYTTIRGTYDGPFAGGQIESKKFEFNTMDIFRLQDGMLAEHWDVVDVYTLFLQFGLLEP